MGTEQSEHVTRTPSLRKTWTACKLLATIGRRNHFLRHLIRHFPLQRLKGLILPKVTSNISSSVLVAVALPVLRQQLPTGAGRVAKAVALALTKRLWAS